MVMFLTRDVLSLQELEFYMRVCQQNLTILASGEKLFLFRIHWKDYYSGPIIWETN